jgi:hypothetical protein
MGLVAAVHITAGPAVRTVTANALVVNGKLTYGVKVTVSAAGANT